MKVIQTLVFLSAVLMAQMSSAQVLSDSIWSQLLEFTKTQINNSQVYNHVDVIRENAKRISNNPEIDHSKYINAIEQTLKQLQPMLSDVEDIIKGQLLLGIQQGLFFETVSPILLGQTSESEKEEFFSTLNFNIKPSSDDQITIGEMGFSSLVISENSKNYLTMRVKTKIEDLISVELKTGEEQSVGFGAAILESSNGTSVSVPIQVGQSVEDEDDNMINFFAGEILGKNLDLTQKYQVKKVAVIFENESGDYLYNMKSIPEDPTLTLKPIDTGLVDFITNSEYAISFDKFQQAVAKGNVLPFDDGGNFIVRGGEHSLGVMIWRDEDLFAFYRCHNDNYAEKIINAENCWIIKAPRAVMPSGFETTPYMYYGVYKVVEIGDNFTNLDYMLNRVTYNLNHNQGLMYEYSDKIYANGNKQLEAIRNTKAYNNLLSGLYDEHASFFEDVMKYTYYFGVGTAVGAVIDTVTKKAAHKFHGYKADSRFHIKKPGAFGAFSLTNVYKVALKYGSVIMGGTAILYGVNKGMKWLDNYMMEREFSLDLVLAMKEEMRQFEGEKEYYIEANRQLVDVIQAAIIDVLKNYNAREKEDVYKLSKEQCEKVYKINCSKEMIQSLYPEGA